ncbi:MAG: UDP-N-acetyl glucosamine 2-epimerase [Anaerolineaceae bacterium]|nr:UDP-N-acetyl glucosamine 2-epimerase [Anaerolineaceae bacterium]
MREKTERPITCAQGTHVLVGQDTDRLCAEVQRALDRNGHAGKIPPLWDSCAGERIAKVILTGSVSESS